MTGCTGVRTPVCKTAQGYRCAATQQEHCTLVPSFRGTDVLCSVQAEKRTDVQMTGVWAGEGR